MSEAAEFDSGGWLPSGMTAFRNETGLPERVSDPALRGLEGRARGSACTTVCAPDCDRTCHERCKPEGASRTHDDYYCDQIRIGRDVSEYAPEIRLRFEAGARARKAAGR